MTAGAVQNDTQKKAKQKRASNGDAFLKNRISPISAGTTLLQIKRRTERTSFYAKKSAKDFACKQGVKSLIAEIKF